MVDNSVNLDSDYGPIWILKSKWDSHKLRMSIYRKDISTLEVYIYVLSTVLFSIPFHYIYHIIVIQQSEASFGTN